MTEQGPAPSAEPAPRSRGADPAAEARSREDAERIAEQMQRDLQG